MNFLKSFRLLVSLFALALAPFFLASSASAHEVTPPIIDITVDEEQATIGLSLNAEIFLAYIDASAVTDTNDAEEADDYDKFRALDIATLEQHIRARQDELLNKITIRSAGQPLALSISAVETEDNPDLLLPRTTFLAISADLPAGNDPVIVQLSPDFGSYIIRQNAEAIPEEDLYADFISAGRETQPIPRIAKLERSWGQVFVQYIVSGIEHIIPKGLDHIVFIMGLFFFSPKFRPLLMQVTVFTLAHSVTLAMATLKLVYIPASIVEALIALSIAWIGIENIVRPKIGIGRLGVIFIFGLLHGLGFAFVLDEVGLSGSAFAVSLIAFNIGVELGQLLVLAPLLVMGYFLSHRKDYRKRLEIPVSAAIALVGIYWFLERVIGAF